MWINESPLSPSGARSDDSMRGEQAGTCSEGERRLTTACNWKMM